MNKLKQIYKVVCVILNIVFLTGFTFGETCSRKSSCSCDCPNGVLDLKSLASTNGQPTYKDYAAADTYKYSYNPCEPFTETSVGTFVDECQNVAACQVIEQGEVFQYYDTGTQDSVTFYTTDSDSVGIPDNEEVVVAKYIALNGGRQTEVVLVCNDKDDQTAFAVIGELPGQPIATYRYVLVSPKCCLVPSGLSGGTILIIIFFVLVAAYLIIGVIFKKFITKASGRDIIPNVDFWTSLPGLIKEGFTCVIRRGNYTNIK